ncbi:hypothetical protein [Aliiroseovarius sp.]|uniref:hypothetical protein n=1 Tax=Aliiroseovarius sp. TaxID=1872442 RepID=UPI00261BCEB0|nr:hypothetical protein [Aliiroseovarius sp.]
MLVLLASSRAAFSNFADLFTLFVAMLSGVVWMIRGARVMPAAIIFVVVSLVWVAVHSFLSGVVSWTTYGGHFLRMLAGIFVLGAVARPLELMVTWVIRLSLAGFTIYGLGLAAPGVISQLHALTPDAFTMFGGTLFGETLTSGWPRANWIFYTLAPTRWHQNHGFMWEPAAYAMICAFALWYRMLQGKLGFDRDNLILLVAIASTVSTTGMVALAFSLGVLLLHHGMFGMIAVMLTLPWVGLFFLQAEFMIDKIVQEFQAGYSPHMQWSLTRAASFQLDMQSFSQAPLLGQGIVIEASHALKYRPPSNNGFSDYLTRYGLVMSTYLAALFIISTRAYFRARVLMVLGMCMVLFLFSWSEKYFELPLFYVMSFAGFYNRRETPPEPDPLDRQGASRLPATA